ncbi:MAG: hypothetical protein ACEQSR_09570 [Candidatus Methylacidiphilales bacterium]
MIRLFLPSILCFIIQSIFVNYSIAQTRNIILHIDTVDYNGYQEFYIKTQGQNKLRPFIINSDLCLVNDIGLTCKLAIINDTSTIRISIDKKGGFLEIFNSYQLISDTLSISKIFVFDKPYLDTNWITTNYFYIQKDTLAQNFKTTRKYKIDRISKKNAKPISTSYLINGRKYFCNAKWKQSNYKFLITKTHGYGKTGFFKKGKPYYFHGSTRSTITHNVITIQLKH